MPIYGTAPSQSILPGQIGYFFGNPALPGTPVAAADEAIAANAKSRPVVIPAVNAGTTNTQRQITWQVNGTGTYNFNLQASIDDVDGDYVTVDNYTGSNSSGPRHVQADASTAALSTSKVVANARFFRVVENSGSPVTATVRATAL